ncbi:uncharacterized protein [Primulina eburnea]|uniref:uncharacterized protein n=1 Tax=Primulina eburnea TaxID=1245227 RepID=UPI003C6C5B3B
MTTFEMSHLDLECGRRSGVGASARGGGAEEEEGGSVCFSDADEDSCNSQFYSTADGEGSYDDFSIACGSEPGEIPNEDDGLENGRSSDCLIIVENGGVEEIKVHLGMVERDCRICHLSLVSSSPGSGVAIELGCSCKDDLAAAHKNCAETWFKIKGNKTCEICNSVACNVVGLNEIDAAANENSGSVSASMASAAPAPPSAGAIETRSCLNGHRFLNFLLACMVFAFVISWLFHFNIPS